MRTVGDWVLAALGVITLLIFAVFLWWFGPWHAPLAFSVWALLSASLLIIAYRRTRSRWLLYVGSGLIPSGFVVGIIANDVWMGGLWQAKATVAVVAALPLALTVAWMRRLVTRSQAPQERITALTGMTIAACAAIMIGTFSWARADGQKAAENPTYISRFAGCYEVDVGPWIPSIMLGHAA